MPRLRSCDSPGSPHRRGSFPFILATLAVALLGMEQAARVHACSICESDAPTICEEIGKADIAVFGVYTRTPKGSLDNPDSYKALFRIEQVLRGRDALGKVREARVLFFPGPNVKPGAQFLILGNKLPELRWTTPIYVDARSIVYIKKMLQLPEKGIDRVLFAMDYLEDEQAMLRRDAYDEFGKADYVTLQMLRPKLEADALIAKIEADETEPSMRRLYYTLLSVCARPEDRAWLEVRLREHAPNRKASLGALIACYLTVTGADGLALVEQEYLTSESPDDRMTAGAAVIALRFHGQESNVIERKEILEVFRHLLDRPQLAGRILSDLARWEDWSVLDRVVQLFHTASDDTGWIRQPVVQYLSACPLPEAKVHLEALKKIDPDVVRRALRFSFPGPSAAASGSTEPSGKEASPSPTEVPAVQAATRPSSDRKPDANAARSGQGEISADRTILWWIGLSVVAVAAFMVLFLRGVFVKRNT